MLVVSAVPELIDILYIEEYVPGILLQVPVFLLCTCIARPPSLARRRTWLYAAIPGTNNCCSNVPGTWYDLLPL